MFLSVVIPAYNEEKRLPATLASVKAYLDKQTYESEIIVVNNNSTDATRTVAEAYPGVLVLNESRKGKGYAVAHGMIKARGELRLFMDADNSTTIEHAEAMMAFIKQGYDVVIGSLAVPGARVVRGEPAYRVIMGKLGNKWIQLWAVWGVHDTQRGFKMFTARAADQIFSKLTIFGWGFDVEVLALAKKLRYRIREVPVTWNNDPNSKVNIWAYPKVLWETVRVRWNLFTNIYGF